MRELYAHFKCLGHHWHHSVHIFQTLGKPILASHVKKTMKRYLVSVIPSVKYEAKNENDKWMVGSGDGAG